jgi:hypothetical protein
MDVAEDPWDESETNAFEHGPDTSQGSARWRRSFVEHMDSTSTSRLITWLAVGLAVVIVATFILAA